MNVLGKLPSLEKHFVLSLNFHEHVPCRRCVCASRGLSRAWAALIKAGGEVGGAYTPPAHESIIVHVCVFVSVCSGCVYESFTVIFSCNDFNFGFLWAQQEAEEEEEEAAAGADQLDQVGRLAVLDPPPGLLAVL